MKFLHLFNKSSSGAGFARIQGYEDIKDIVRRALESDENYNLLFVGPPASSKTLFLQGILEMKGGMYFDGSNTTNRILDVLQERRPKIICIDELDKMSRQFQNQLLNFMEYGRVKVDQQKKQYDFQIKGAKIFGTCNEINRLSKPLQSRFRSSFYRGMQRRNSWTCRRRYCLNLLQSCQVYWSFEVWNWDMTATRRYYREPTYNVNQII